MNILMVTNTYLPSVGGLERSVAQFTACYRKRGHRVIVVAPACKNVSPNEPGVIRVPALQRSKGTDWTLQVPLSPVLSRALQGFRPDIVHAHHPFLLGETALRLAYAWNVPLVFTHHTLFEHYTYVLPLDSPAVKQFVIQLATGYANLCDQVFAPSESVRKLLIARGVKTPVDVVPTGIPLEHAGGGSGARLRTRLGISPGETVIGHVGRLSPEKNLGFLSRAVALFLRRNRKAHFLLVGKGPSQESLLETFRRWGVLERVHVLGILRDQDLKEAYRAMDLFVFSSKSETQGLVLLEAMAVGVPVAALRAPGVVDLLRNHHNGFLLDQENVEDFAGALGRFTRLSEEDRRAMGRRARATAARFSMERCADRALRLYRRLEERRRARKPLANSGWARALRWMRGEWRLVRNVTGAALSAVESRRAGEH